MALSSLDTFGAKSALDVDGRRVGWFDLGALERAGVGPVSRLPMSLKILLENLLRREDGTTVKAADIEALARWDGRSDEDREIAFMPARVLLQDFTGVPLVVDLAAMRDAVAALGGDPARVNPQLPVDLVIDHSVQVDQFAHAGAFAGNVDLEYQRNRERYAFLRWGQRAFDGLRVVPPGTGICHQVNLECLAGVVFERDAGGGRMALPDTLVGTDSHTTMINGLGVLGWGVGGIEAEAAMLGQAISMNVPPVIGFRLHGAMPPGTTATDLVLTVTQRLRAKGVVGKFVEFFGTGLSSLPLADRATLANLAPEYGATMGYFPIDGITLDYLRRTGRSDAQVTLVEAYAKAQGLFRTDASPDPVFTDTLELDLRTVEPSIAGPRRPQDRVPLKSSREAWRKSLAELKPGPSAAVDVTADGQSFQLRDGAVVIAAITSCTNTSNPSVLVAAGLLARNAVARGLATKPWVKTSLAPGSRVVTRYLDDAGLTPALDALGFALVGYGCTTCIGNSGPLPPAIAAAVESGRLVAAAVLSGNRNFEGRVNPLARANYLASPPLVVAYALAGTMDVDFETDALGVDPDGTPVYLRDLWPSPEQVADVIRTHLKPSMFTDEYGDVFAGDERWRALPVPEGDRYAWDDASTYIRRAPFLDGLPPQPPPLQDLAGLRVLAVFGDSITTDHISPAGSIARNGPAAKYLVQHGVAVADFNQYGARRGNHEVMVRGTFANIRIKNLMVPGVEGGVAVHRSSPDPLSIFDAAEAYAAEGVPLMIIAGREYGSGSSRDWAAKGPRLLGVRAVLAESFERIHRSNLVQLGILPLEFEPGQGREALSLTGRETFTVAGLEGDVKPRQRVTVTATAPNTVVKTFHAIARLDTAIDVAYYRHGGILPYVLRQLQRESDPNY